MGEGGGEGSGLGGQGGCDRRIEKFLGKFTKKKFRVGGGGLYGGGVRVDVNEELKFLCKFKGQGGCESRIEVFWEIQKKLELMFMKHYAPNRCLYIKVAKLRTGVGRGSEWM